MAPPPAPGLIMSPNDGSSTTTTTTVRKRGGISSSAMGDISSGSEDARPRTGRGKPSSPTGLEDSGFGRMASGALAGASGKGLMEEELRSDYVLQSGSQEDLGSPIGQSREQPQYLTLLDEVVLLGLKDQQGYLSFTNDTISYVLRGCIIIELALRRRIRIIRDSTSRRPFPDRYLEVIDASRTGEVILDEALKLIKAERHSIGTWIDLMSGETWNPLKVGYQLKQVRERIAKGLVDKGVLRTEKHSFLLFDMATHPVACASVKEDLVKRTLNTCLGRGPVPSLRSIALVCAASSANVLEGVLSKLSYSERESAFNRADDFVRLYTTPSEKAGPLPPANEILAGVLTVFARLDSILY